MFDCGNKHDFFFLAVKIYEILLSKFSTSIFKFKPFSENILGNRTEYTFSISYMDDEDGTYHIWAGV